MYVKRVRLALSILVFMPRGLRNKDQTSTDSLAVQGTFVHLRLTIGGDEYPDLSDTHAAFFQPSLIFAVPGGVDLDADPPLETLHGLLVGRAEKETDTRARTVAKSTVDFGLGARDGGVQLHITLDVRLRDDDLDGQNAAGAARVCGDFGVRVRYTEVSGCDVVAEEGCIEAAGGEECVVGVGDVGAGVSKQRLRHEPLTLLAVLALAAAGEGLLEAHSQTVILGLEACSDGGVGFLRGLRGGECEVNQSGSFGRPVEELGGWADPVEDLDVGAIGEDDEFVA